MVTAREIAAVAAAEFDAAPEDVLTSRGKGTLGSVRRARWLAWWLARRLTSWSLVEIGARVSAGFHHTSVLHGQRRIAEMMAEDPAFAARAGALLEALLDDAEPPADRLAALSRDLGALRREAAVLRADVDALRKELAAERARIDRMHAAPVSARNDDRDAAPVSARNDDRDAAMIAAHRRRRRDAARRSASEKRGESFDS